MNKQAVVIIPIYHPDWKFNKLLQMLKSQKEVQFDVYVIDSGSDMNKYKRDLEKLSYTYIKINPQKFNHGGTRRQAAIDCQQYPFLIYMTQDAVPVNEYSLFHLLEGFHNQRVGCAYGRQIPYQGASIMASMSRYINYPDKGQILGMKDIPKYKIKTAFCSDSFAAYRLSALKNIDWFPDNVLFGEDMYAAGKMILNGWNKAYCADAVVYHSHEYTFKKEIQRYFDMGVFHTREPWLLKTFGKAEGAGIKFLKQEFLDLIKTKPWQLPTLLLHTMAKYVGYQLGMKEKYLPVFMKKRLSLQSGYWSNNVNDAFYI